jgi:hypothetical protein
MGFGKSLKKAFKKASKSISKAFKSAVNTVVDVTVGIVSGEYLLKATGAIVKFVGADIVDDVLGLDSLGDEMARIGSDVYQVGKVLGGEYHDDMKAFQRQQERVQAQINAYNNNVNILSEKIDSLIAFHEIFQMAASNRLDEYTSTYGPQLDAAIAALNRAAAKLRSEYDFVISLTEGAFIQKLAGSIIMIVGGLMSDFKDIASGNANGDTWKRAITVIILVIVIILMWWNPGGWAAMTALQVTALVLTTIVTFMTLDGMYANGAATGAIMSAFDFIFNDLLNLDEIIGSDFEKFDKDHEDYKEMVMYTKLAMSLGAAGASYANSLTAASSSTASATTVSDALAAAQSEMTQTTAAGASSGAGNAFSNTNMSIGSTASNSINSSSTFFGIDISTYSSIYKAFSAASDVKDIVNSKKAYDALLDKFREDALKLETAIVNKYSKNFMKHYKDTAYFLQDQQEYIDRYIWGMTSESMYVDPYGTTPVANMRFTPDKDTRVMSFGFEDMFDESSVAGSKGYFNSILYGS